MQNVHKKEMRRYNFLLDRIRIESTEGDFGTHEKVAISFPILTCRPTFPIPVVTCTMNSHSHFWHTCVPIPMHISNTTTQRDADVHFLNK